MRVLLEKSNPVINKDNQSNSDLFDIFQAMILQNMLPNEQTIPEETTPPSVTPENKSEQPDTAETIDALLQQVFVSYLVPESPPTKNTADATMMTEQANVTNQAQQLNLPGNKTLTEQMQITLPKPTKTTSAPKNEKLTVDAQSLLLADSNEKPKAVTAQASIPDNEILTQEFSKLTLPAHQTAKAKATSEVIEQQSEPDAPMTDKIHTPLNQWLQIVNHDTNPTLVSTPATPMARASEVKTTEPMHMVLESVVVNKQSDNEAYVANIKVHPAELGPVQAKIQIHKNTVQITLTIKQADTEEVVKKHLASLVQQFTDQKMQVESITIQAPSANIDSDKQGSQEQGKRGLYQGPEQALDTESNTKTPSSKKERQRTALVDTYI